MPVRRVLEWPFAPHAGIRSVTVHSATRNSEPYTRMVLTASFGGDLTGIELSVGLDLDLPPQDTAQVFGASEHLIGQGVTLKLIHHAARLQGNGMTLSGIVTSRR